jgi:hypothetical protein
MPSSRIPDAVKNIFLETFTARDIAEPLASFDANAATVDVSAFMEARCFDVVGIRREGRIVGYVERGLPSEGTCDQFGRPLGDAAVVNDTPPLLPVLVKLN